MKPFAKKLLALAGAAVLTFSAIPAVRSADAGLSNAAQLPVAAQARTLSAAQSLNARSTQSVQPVQQIPAEVANVIMDRVVSFFSDWQEIPEQQPQEPQRDLGLEVAQLAQTKVGCRYVSGGHGPSKFDCSGLVYWVYKQFGYELKPGARNQWSLLGSTIKKADLRPGDLLFFTRNGKSSGIFHVGIYIGDGRFVHAANSRKGVIVTSMSEAWYANRYLGAKRAIN